MNEELKAQVRDYLTQKLQDLLWSEFEGRIADVWSIKSHFPEYSPEWCIESITPNYDAQSDELIREYVDMTVEALFYYEE